MLALVCVAFLATVRADSLELGLLAHFKLDGNAADATGHGYSGTVAGVVSGTVDRLGNANGAMAFDRNGYISVGGLNLLNGAASAAITGWVRNRMGMAEGGFVVGAGDAWSGQDPLTLKFSGSNLVEALFTGTTLGSSDPNRYVGFEGDPFDLTLPQNEWISFVSQFSSVGGTTTYQLYLNGSLAVQIDYARSAKVDYARDMPVQIGALTGYGDSQFRGDIDDLRFYDRVLTAEEVGRLAGVPETGLTVLHLVLAAPSLAAFGWAKATRNVKVMPAV